uniref:Reverse transcriptase domain-containing protein n=1 Tax=Mycena chlorophos TaxID=658473 RepID=A0ABQ0L759_MYCCL|nr:predicted protein [Mycena chlorophos]
MMDPKPLPILVTADSLRNEFETRSNAPRILPAQFDANTYKMNHLRAVLIPDSTVDSTPEQFFSRQFQAELEIPKLITHLEKHPSRSATGEDARDVPSAWLKATTVGILKPGKPATDPASYRLVVLESCGLKGLTTLVHMRITEWSNARKLIPPWQNGFREKFRTNNNPFILRCAKEWASANGRTLYVAYVDFSNAFPWTDQETLWLKLRKLGMSGPIFDGLRMLYGKMEYHVKHGDTTSEHYKALLGLLTGDPASPGLWNLFLSDLLSMKAFIVLY